MAAGRSGRSSRRFLRDQRGGLLMEAVLAIGILTGVLSFAVQGVATGSKGMKTVRYLTTAQNIARSQMEYTLNSAYCAAPCAYPTVTVPSTYSVTAEAEAFMGADSNLGYVVVTVSKDDVVLVRIKSVKVNR